MSGPVAAEEQAEATAKIIEMVSGCSRSEVAESTHVDGSSRHGVEVFRLDPIVAATCQEVWDRHPEWQGLGARSDFLALQSLFDFVATAAGGSRQAAVFVCILFHGLYESDAMAKAASKVLDRGPPLASSSPEDLKHFLNRTSEAVDNLPGKPGFPHNWIPNGSVLVQDFAGHTNELWQFAGQVAASAPTTTWPEIDAMLPLDLRNHRRCKRCPPSCQGHYLRRSPV